MRKWLKRLVVLGILAGLSYGAWMYFGKKEEKKPVELRQMEATVEPHDFTASVLATGTVKTMVGAQVNVGARVSGKVKKLNVNIGDEVKRGEVIAEIEHDDLDTNVKQRQAELALVQVQVESMSAKAEAQKAQLERIVSQRELEVATAKRRVQALAAEGQASIELYESQIRESRASRDYASKDVARMEKLFKGGFLPEQTLDKSKTELATSRSRLESARKQSELTRTKMEEDLALQESAILSAEAVLATARQELDTLAKTTEADIAVLEAGLPKLESLLQETRIKLSYATVTAPIDGIIGTVSTQEGETVAAGFNAPTFVTVVNLTQLQVDAYVDEVDIGKIKVGQPASFTVDAFPDEEFKGKVTAIYPTAIIQDNVVYYDVVVAIEPGFEGRLRPEMTANITIVTTEKRGVPAIPTKAMQRKAGAYVVAVKTEEGIDPREVKAGMDDGTMLEIVSGVKMGERVVYEVEVESQGDGDPEGEKK